MPELTPRIFETIFFQHIKGLTLGRGNTDNVRLRLQSFDYQFSDRWLSRHPYAK